MGHLTRLEARIPIGDLILQFGFNFQVGISGSQTRGGSDSVGQTSDEGEEKVG